MANAADFPPSAQSVDPSPALDPAAVAAWEQELDRTLAQMAVTIGAAVQEHEAGRLTLSDLQQQCLAAGVVRTGGEGSAGGRRPRSVRYCVLRGSE